MIIIIYFFSFFCDPRGVSCRENVRCHVDRSEEKAFCIGECMCKCLLTVPFSVWRERAGECRRGGRSRAASFSAKMSSNCTSFTSAWFRVEMVCFVLLCFFMVEHLYIVQLQITTGLQAIEKKLQIFIFFNLFLRLVSAFSFCMN